MSEELWIALIAAIGPIGAVIGSFATIQYRQRKEWREGGEKAYEKAIEILRGRFDRANDPKELAAIEQQLREAEDDYLPYLKTKSASISRRVRGELAPAGAITPDMPALSPSDREALENATATIAAFDPPKTTADHLSQGNAFYAAGEIDKALLEYDAALELTPDDPDSLGNRGILLDTLHRYNEALSAYNRSLELRPDDARTFDNRGNTLGHLGHHEEALADYNRSLELLPDDPNTLYNRACAYSRMGRFKDSLQGLREAISRDAEYREAARADEDFANLRSDPTLGPEFERLVAEPED